MKFDLKPTAILVATLSVGVVLGMVGQGMLMQDRSRRVQALRRPPGFVSQLEDAIQPREDQRDTVHKLLDLAAARNEAIYEADRKRLGAALDTMRMQLAPLLDKEQQARLAQVSQLPDPSRPPRKDGPRDDRQSPRDDRQSPRDDNRPSRDDNRPPRDDNRPPRDDNRPPRDDNRPPRDNNRPPPADHRSSGDTERPPSEP